MEETYNKLADNKHKVFFAATGLSMSEADHKANLIKEKNSTIAALFSGTAAYTAVLNFEEGKKIPLDAFREIDLEGNAKLEGHSYALSAWLREAIKAKEELLAKFTNLPVSLLMIDDEAYPLNELIAPKKGVVPRPPQLTEADIIGKLTIAERAEYLTLEAQCAHLGKKIHSGGIISGIRRQLQDNKTSSFMEKSSGTGPKTYVVDYTALYDVDQIDALFFKLQEEHRTMEAKLNWYKAKIKNDIATENAQLYEKYINALKMADDAYYLLNKVYSDELMKYQDAVRKVNEKLEARRLALIKYISTLKIVVPKDLEHVLRALEEKK